MKAFNHLFEVGIQEAYQAEHEIIKALPELARAAKEPKLKEALRHHLEETKEQAARLESIAAELEIELKKAPSPVMHVLLQIGHNCAKADLPPEVRDAAIIAAARCVEHHEMAVYETLRTYACLLNFHFAERKLVQTLEEESGAEEKLAKIAEGTLFTTGINKKACEQEGS